MIALPRVLIADDTPDILSAHTLMLTAGEPCARVVGALDGKEALAAYESAVRERDPFELLVLDLAMPGMNGFGVAEAIRSLGDTETKIVFFSNYDSDIENDYRAKACGAVGVWRKIPGGKSTQFNFREKVIQLLQNNQPDFQDSPAEVPKTAVKEIAQVAVKREKRNSLVLWVVGVGLFGNICLTLFNMARTPRVYTAISSINKKLDGAVTTSALPNGYRVTVPPIKSSYKRLAPAKDGSYRSRITFEFEPKDAAAAASIAADRDAVLWLSVTREK